VDEYRTYKVKEAEARLRAIERGKALCEPEVFGYVAAADPLALWVVPVRALDRLHQREPARRPESGVSVNLHPGPPWLGRQNHKPLGGPGCLSGVHNVCGRVS
jgi:hypothetical protein